MDIREVTPETPEEYAEAVRARGKGVFRSRTMRDAVHRITGGRRYSMRNQQLHPEYVTDYVGTIHSGFGNTQYRTQFSVLYMLDLGL